jgi:uncharacterized repeat protein (TIGR01451 family)
MNTNRYRFCIRLTAACVPIFCFAGTQPKVAVDFGKVPLSFEANRGQSEARVDYLSRGKGYTLLLTRGQAVLKLQTKAPGAAGPSMLRMKLLGASGTAAASGLDQLPGKANYFRGNDPSKWHTGIPTYQKVKYTGVYPGVDLVYYGNQGRLEHDFIVAPGADPSKIVLSFEGAQPRIDRHGDLCLTIDGSEVRFEKPVVYQAASGGKRRVDGRYALAGNRVRFELGAYDQSRGLTIDPLLAYASYLGGSGTDYGTGIAVDSQGSAYVTGVTTSTDFPTENPIYGAGDFGGEGYDVFVTKFNSSGTALIYSTYLTGSALHDQTSSNDIAVDSEFNAYVGGTTDANDFPVTGGAFQTICGGSSDSNGRLPGCGPGVGQSAFLTEIDAAGSALVYSTFLGGNDGSTITGVAVDSAGEAYVTGFTSSVGGPDQPTYYGFPTTSSALLPGSWNSPGYGSAYAFFTKFAAGGGTLVYSTLYGSNTPPNVQDSGYNQWPTEGYAIAIDANGDAYITGYTISGNLPVSAGAFQTTAAPLIGAPNAIEILGWRGFVAKFDPTQSGTASLIYGTYLGGTGGTGGNAADFVTGIAVDSGRNAYLTGHAGSPNFPTTRGAFQRTCDSDGGVQCSTAFITKLNSTGAALVYSTMLGNQADGSGSAVTATRIRVDSSDDAFVTGYTSNGFPLQNPIATIGTGFVTELNPTGRALLFSTYLEGSYVLPASLAVDSQGSIYVTGETNALTVTPGAFQQNLGGSYDAFAVKIATIASDVQVTNAAPKSVVTGADLVYTITAVNNGPDAASKVVVTDAVPAGSTFVSVITSAGACTSPVVGGTGTVRCTIGNLAVSATATVTLTVNVNAAARTILTGTARISAAGFDPNTANNSSTAKTKVVR